MVGNRNKDCEGDVRIEEEEETAAESDTIRSIKGSTRLKGFCLVIETL